MIFPILSIIAGEVLACMLIAGYDKTNFLQEYKDRSYFYYAYKVLMGR